MWLSEGYRYASSLWLCRITDSRDVSRYGDHTALLTLDARIMITVASLLPGPTTANSTEEDRSSKLLVRNLIYRPNNSLGRIEGVEFVVAPTAEEAICVRWALGM